MVDGGLTTTAETIRLDRRSGDAAATGDVKSTYSELKARPGGALLASSDPIHVTAPSMRAVRGSGTAVYSGGARLWQGSSIVQAPVIEFNRHDGRLVARTSAPGATAGAVTTTFVQQDQTREDDPGERRVGAVDLPRCPSARRALRAGWSCAAPTRPSRRTGLMSILQARGQTAGAAGQAGPSQVERIVAEGQVIIQQPNRRATGEKLVYTASDGKFVLTGGPA